MSRSLLQFACLAGALSASVAILQAQTTPWQPPNEAGEGQRPIMPVHEEPHHRQVFQHGPVRILDLQIPPGDTSWFHSHDWPVYYLTTADSPTSTQVLGEPWGAGRGRGGAGAGARGAPPPSPAVPAPARGPARGRPRLMSDVSYAERPVTHRIRNVGDNLFRAMVVVNETEGGDEGVTPEEAGFADTPLSSNRWFRAYRVTLAPSQRSMPHVHNAPVVILQDTTGTGRGIGPMTFELNEPGQWAFFDSGVRHELANTGTAPLDLIEIEVRRK